MGNVDIMQREGDIPEDIKKIISLRSSRVICDGELFILFHENSKFDIFFQALENNNPEKYRALVELARLEIQATHLSQLRQIKATLEQMSSSASESSLVPKEVLDSHHVIETLRGVYPHLDEIVVNLDLETYIKQLHSVDKKIKTQIGKITESETIDFGSVSDQVIEWVQTSAQHLVAPDYWRDIRIQSTMGALYMDWIKAIYNVVNSSLRTIEVSSRLSAANPNANFNYNAIADIIGWKEKNDEFVRQIKNLKSAGIVELAEGKIVFVNQSPYPYVLALFAIWEQNESIRFKIDDADRKTNQNVIIQKSFFIKKDGEVSEFKRKSLDKIRSDETYKNYVGLLEKVLQS